MLKVTANTRNCFTMTYDLSYAVCLVGLEGDYPLEAVLVRPDTQFGYLLQKNRLVEASD